MTNIHIQTTYTKIKGINDLEQETSCPLRGRRGPSPSCSQSQTVSEKETSRIFIHLQIVTSEYVNTYTVHCTVHCTFCVQVFYRISSPIKDWKTWYSVGKYQIPISSFPCRRQNAWKEYHHTKWYIPFRSALSRKSVFCLSHSLEQSRTLTAMS